MTEEQRETGAGWPEPAVPSRPETPADPRPDAPPADGVAPLVDDASALGTGQERAGAGRGDAEERRPEATVSAEEGVPLPPTPEAEFTSESDSTVRLAPAGPADPTVPLPLPPTAADRDGDGDATVRLDAGGDADPAEDAETTGRAESGQRPAGRSDSVWVRLGLTSPRFSGAGAMIGVLLALLGFVLAVQLKSSSDDPTLAAMRQDDLVRILSDLESQESRLRQDIAGLEDSQRQLTSGAQGRQAALDEATRRADELGILAGTLPARGPGLTITFSAVPGPIRASTILDAVQELRGAGAEAMQIADRDNATVRIVAATYFLDTDGDITVSGRRLVGPYTITAIGDPTTMRTALNIPGGVVASVNGDGGNVIVQEHEVVDVSALSAPTDLKHARPVS